MKKAPLIGALPIYAKLLADSCGVELVMGASCPRTDGRKIYLPDLPADSEIAADLAFGWIMHEEGHISESEFGNILPGFVGHIAGIIEDVRMERVQQSKYPGARKRLARTVDRMVKLGRFAPVGEEESPSAAVQKLLLYGLRSDVLGQTGCSEYAKAAVEKCRELLPESTVVRLNALMYQVRQCRNSSDANTLAELIVTMMKEEAKDPPPPEPDASGDSEPDANGDSEPDANGDSEPDANGDSEPDASGDSEPDASGDSEPDANGDSEPDASGDSEPDANGDSEPDASGDSEPDANGDAGGKGHGSDDQKRSNLKKILTGEDNEIVPDMGEEVAKVLAEQAASNPYGATTIHLSRDEVAPSNAQATSVLDSVRDKSKALKRKLYNLLDAKAECVVSYGRHGRFSSRRITRIPSGDMRVFERKDEGQTLDTAVQVLIDRSGSMAGILDTTYQVGLALSAALDGLSGVDVATAAFPHYILGGYANDVLVLKKFGEPLRVAASRFENATTCGCTPMAEALMWSGLQLMRQKEERKILFVVTDGDPDSMVKAVYVRDQLEMMGIEVLGLGIGLDVSAVFPINRTVNSIDSLNKCVFEMMSTQLLMLDAA